MRSLKESILRSNDAGIVGVVKDMLQIDPGLGKKRADHLSKLNDLWEKLGLWKHNYYWGYERGAYFLRDAHQKKPKAYIGVRTNGEPNSYFYIASNKDSENRIDETLKHDIVKKLSLKLLKPHYYWDCYRM